MTAPITSDDELVTRAVTMLDEDNPWQERVAAATLLGRTDPTTDMGRRATDLLADLCVHDQLVELITEAAYQLMTGGRERVFAYMEAWTEAEDCVSGWMDNCILLFPPESGAPELVRDLRDSAGEAGSFQSARQCDASDYATDWLVHHCYEEVPPGVAAALGWSAEQIARHNAVARGEVRPEHAEPWPIPSASSPAPPALPSGTIDPRS